MIGLIIFGTRGVTSTRGTDLFDCPTCGKDAWYSRKSVRRFFTLYYIPVLPLGEVADYVECEACHGTFQPAVLQSRERRLQLVAAMRGVVVRVLRGAVTPERLAEAGRLIQAIGGAPVDADALRSEAEGAAPPVASLFVGLRDALTDGTRERILQLGLRVAAADGTVSDADRLVLVEVGEAVGLDSAVVLSMLSG